MILRAGWKIDYSLILFYSTKSVGEEAAPYTVNFYKYSVSGEGTNAEYTWKKDDSLTITGWGGGKEATTEYVSFPEVSKADFFIINTSNSSISGAKLAAATDSTNKGKYAVAVAQGSGEVTAYVGESLTLSVSGWAVPGGYSSSGDATPSVSATSGEGFSGASYNSGSGEATITVNTANEVTLTVKYPVHKVKVTYDLNTSAVTGLVVADIISAPAAVYVNSSYKVASNADVSKITGTVTTGSGESATTQEYIISGWAKTNNGAAINETNKTFNENTTLYAVWAVKSSS